MEPTRIFWPQEDWYKGGPPIRNPNLGPEKKNNQKVDKIWGVELEFIIYSIASTLQKYKRFMLDAMAWWNASKLCPMSILGEKLKFSTKWNYRKSHFGLWYTYLSNYYMAKCFTRSFQKHKPLISKDWLTKIYTRVRY